MNKRAELGEWQKINFLKSQWKTLTNRNVRPALKIILSFTTLGKVFFEKKKIPRSELTSNPIGPLSPVE